MKRDSEKPVSIWEIMEIVHSASDSVKPAAMMLAQKVASEEMAKRKEPNLSKLPEKELENTDSTTITV